MRDGKIVRDEPVAQVRAVAAGPAAAGAKA
jgi:hypothetical protein